MDEKEVKPYGSWRSPITSDLIVAGSIRLGEVELAGENIYWAEGRPSEGGRIVIVRRSPSGESTDVTPPDFNVRTTVHEYGGGAFVIDGDTVYFSNFKDQRIYRQMNGSAPAPVTAEGNFRYADACVDRTRNRLITVREDHTASDIDAANTLVSVALDPGGETTGEVIVSGNDFYSTPRLSPDGQRLAWLTWNHPNLPWDGTELWVAELDDKGAIRESKKIAGGKSESIFQPEWSPDNRLYFVSDRTGWWNLYRIEGDIESEKARQLIDMKAEFGRPQWGFRMSTYAFADASRIICAYNQKGKWRLASLDTGTLKLEPIELPYTEIGYLRAAAGRAVFYAGSPVAPASLVRLDLETREVEVLRRANTLQIDPGYISTARAVEFPTTGGLTAHAFYYAPNNRDFRAIEGERPPLLVISHGGPTSAAAATLEPMIQYWTSRGIAVLDVNYGGSTGYGRAYRERLNGQWGIVDVDDCINGALYMVEQGEADPDRLIIRGGSAGGYTTLAALTFRDVFKAGASYYGICDLEALEVDGHKFEARYNHNLIGPYPAERELYRARSPIHFTNKLSCPIILFQGLEDKVVPPNQAEMMVEAMRAKGLPVAYVPFAGEQHGFRRAENIKRALDTELYFYSKVFGFDADVQPDPGDIARFENFAQR